MGMAVSLSVHVLSQLCIYAYGTDEQKERLLPPMTAGTHLGAFALTEPRRRVRCRRPRPARASATGDGYR